MEAVSPHVRKTVAIPAKVRLRSLVLIVQATALLNAPRLAPMPVKDNHHNTVQIVQATVQVVVLVVARTVALAVVVQVVQTDVIAAVKEPVLEAVQTAVQT